jgi:hypothetical protein
MLDMRTDWPRELARLGVGLAPLSNSRFNRAKSRLKLLEMAALGVPCVVSPRSDYVRLHELGVGTLASSPNDWYREVGRLLRVEAARLEASARGRVVARSLTIENHAHLWWNVWRAALDADAGGRVRSVLVKPTNRP